ncbi:probable RNA-directed DNA polymerase from transposon X-element [Trichonephila clavipes]|uniref:Probable RNA-directed DNA polymerase from transposon X-element n=1 Tax=Trichonephila clavipes TaxID=2585209 RepID=A0A8X7BEE7_TRICX|nr:probable RNA-directed DNA polymerase from transposon X-element [Trichonephila clavipes]
MKYAADCEIWCESRLVPRLRTGDHNTLETLEIALTLEKSTHPCHASRPIENQHRSYTPPHLHQLIHHRNRLRKQYHRTAHKTELNRAQQLVKNTLKQYSIDSWNQRLSALNTQDNSLWNTQKLFKNKRQAIPPLECDRGTAITDTQKANLLAGTLKENFTENTYQNRDTDNHINNTVNTFISTNPTTYLDPVLPDEIITYIKKSSSKKTPGKDGITNRMIPIKGIFILTILINKILKYAYNYFPSVWKEAVIFSILKPGKNAKFADSYRPISLLSTLSKITEYIILSRLKNFTSTNNTINPNQYGFTKNLSTIHPLLKLTETISAGFEKHKTTGAVFLDIQKAFDRVWINGLTCKLISYNFPPSLTQLIHSYITNRTFTVRVNDTYSDSKHTYAGVVQGSLLGPILFNLYLNDIPSYSLTNINIYADDTAILACCRNSKTFTLALNKHLALLENFFDKWKIKINVEKSAAVAFTYKRTLPPPPTMYNQIIPWSQETKYLGLIFDNKLTWKKHITYARDKFRK